MALQPLFLQGNLKINDIDFSEIVESFTITATRNPVEIPKTFGRGKSFRAGTAEYEIEIRYQTDTATPSTLSMLFWEALDDASGTVTYSGSFATGAVSATNPRFHGTAVVTGMALGGEVDTYGVDTVTFPLTARPSKATT